MMLCFNTIEMVTAPVNLQLCLCFIY